MEAEKERECYRTLRQPLSSARGASRMRVIVWTLLFAALLYVSFKIIPPYFANYEFEDDLRQEALFSLGKFNNETVIDRVFKELQAREIDATKESIHIQENDSRALKINVDYTVIVDLKVYDLHLHFTPSSSNESLVQ
ncbi:MAG TPA: hypothetical protein VGZ48_11265 [Candidatus Acidoferrales bacterium]|nr:hypothetical protein [Candidatus Acidoferrales bacterium]